MRRNWLCTVLATVLVTLLLLPQTASAAPNKDSIHFVQRGETLSAIAARYGMNMWTLARYNGIANPNRIYVGQRLVIPCTQTTGRVHVVQWGETLTHIALRYGVSTWSIARANGISNLNFVYVGQRLTIPGTAPPPPPKPPRRKRPPKRDKIEHPPTDMWYGQFFNNESLTGKPVVTTHEPWIGFEWGGDSPTAGVRNDFFSARWTRRIHLNRDHYRFCAMSDDGVRIWVDGKLVLDEWHENNGVAYCGLTYVKTGTHAVKVEYFEHGGKALIYVWWDPA